MVRSSDFVRLGFGAFALIAGCSGGGEQPPPPDGGSDASNDVAPSATYSSIDDSTKWTFFDPTAPDFAGYTGAAFDGRYVYFAPTNAGIASLIQRYDTHAPFDVQASWTSFDQTTLRASATSFGGIVFDGRYMYFVPGAPDAQAGLSVAFRYDTQGDFTSAASWSTYDLATKDAFAKGFIGGTFDGKYVYFAPYQDNLNANGRTARYDTTLPFNSPSSWTIFDMKLAQQYASSYRGVGFDGRYLYYVPSGAVYAMQYDTQGGFNTLGSWTGLDVDSLGDGGVGLFDGLVFDNRYIYFVPADKSIVARYDPQASLGFQAPASWQLFDVTQVNAGAGDCRGGIFDGRYVYLVPLMNSSAFSGYVTRYDTTTNFTDTASWTTFDISTFNANAQGFATAAFDGQYIYFASYFQGLMARFDAKSPPSIPTIPGGSTY